MPLLLFGGRRRGHLATFGEILVMEIEFRLKKILRQHGLHGHGVIQRMARDLHVHRHRIGNLYRNEASHPSLELVAQICGWLITQNVPAACLPQELFGVRPQELWEAISAATKVSICLGEYQQVDAPLTAQRWISRRDAEAAAVVVEYLSRPGNLSGPRPHLVTEYVPFRFDPESSKAADTGCFDEDAQQAKNIFQEMRSRESNCSAILIGSQRVNYLLEHLVADLFGCQPFQPVKRKFKVPFYLKYRDTDRAVTSCFGGTESLPGYESSSPPGIYYLDEKNKWVGCPWYEERSDAGVVIVVRDPGDQSMEMALFGFSGRATVTTSKYLTETAPSGVKTMWPPTAQLRGRHVGVYILRFSLTATDRNGSLKLLDTAGVDVIPLAESVIVACK